ncbi:hypothetical protein EU537_11320 [Candidatus Thorarchaeota archaeon]|nr:MAG: hypothetical protein EU537_11320 [Candidatus Thorarchaeota archaeon]
MKLEKRNFTSVVLCILTFTLPFFLSIQQISDEVTYIHILGPFWQYWTAVDPNLQFSPLPLLIYFPFFAPGFYFVKVVRDAISQSFSSWDYYSKIGFGLFIHLLLLIFFSLASSGYPEPIDIPLPIVGLTTLLIGPFIVPEPTTLWNDE